MKIKRTNQGKKFGLRWQSEAATPLSTVVSRAIVESLSSCESGVAIRFPPHSKTGFGC